MAKKKRKSREKIVQYDTLEQINLNAAGLDIGDAEIWVAVPQGRDEQTVRCFGTFTCDLHALAEWLTLCGIETVAMESTGVYWIPIYELLDERGFDLYLVNARAIKKCVRAANRMFWTVNGFSNCIPMVCYRPPSVPMRRLVDYGVMYDNDRC